MKLLIVLLLNILPGILILKQDPVVHVSQDHLYLMVHDLIVDG